MLGKSVVCPDCGNRIEVPFQSDPRAESLYLRMRHQSPSQPSSPIAQSSTQSATPTHQSSPKPQSHPNLPGSPATRPASPPHIEASQTVIEQVDEWIEKLWADVPDSSAVPEPYRFPPLAQNMDVGKEAAPAPFVEPILIRALWNDPGALRLTAVLFAVVFLIGIGCGFVLRQIVVSERRATGNVAAPENVVFVNGKLFFETPDEKRMPDVDAAVIFLPLGKIPTSPFSGSGLRPRDGAEPAENEPSDIVLQIEELGGKYLRANAEGKFSFSVDVAGPYLCILISSHAIRPAGVSWNAETDRTLRRFFRDPIELLGNYRFRCEEYELRKGETLAVQYNFSR